MRNLQDRIHQMAVEKGWWDKPRSPLEIHALIHSEISEATEAARSGDKSLWFSKGKPEGEAVELADAIIRILDYAGSKGWDMRGVIETKLSYNATRPYRHGNRKW